MVKRSETHATQERSRVRVCCHDKVFRCRDFRCAQTAEKIQQEGNVSVIGTHDKQRLSRAIFIRSASANELLCCGDHVLLCGQEREQKLVAVTCVLVMKSAMRGGGRSTGCEEKVRK